MKNVSHKEIARKTGKIDRLEIPELAKLSKKGDSYRWEGWKMPPGWDKHNPRRTVKGRIFVPGRPAKIMAQMQNSLSKRQKVEFQNPLRVGF
jgi:hypothetical protein